ncbi:TetR family transcriptional regulator [Tabrizicola sp. J26]|uniref:TetR/AcrR family transcriptional regulator n=1 Tax=Alitabrizicola rongguiensis TaxID=2909234 RepID=UPI001F47F158|nr:TetR family transcriptional regulator [Tabrizicola rongguiensis]MCF1710743.1 TetR family transcriptional regulator [Tabrizicola rongguiensis]
MRKTSDLRKAEIVATILALADQIGPDRVTTGAVANEVGVTQAALFRHFPTKAAMWSAVADQVAETLTNAWNAAVAQADLPVDRIRALIRAQLDQIAATPAMPMLLFSRELNVENSALRTAFRGRLTAFHGHLMREVAQGQQCRTLRDDVAAADVAVLLTSLVQGLAIRWSLGARDFGLQAEGSRLLDVQLHLLCAKEG